MGIKREATVEEAVISARRRKRHRTLELNEIYRRRVIGSKGENEK